METFPIFMDWILLKWLLKWSKESVQSYWNPNKVFHRNRKTNLKIHTESQVTMNNKNNLEKEEWSRRIVITWFQNLLQSNSN